MSVISTQQSLQNRTSTVDHWPFLHRIDVRSAGERHNIRLKAEYKRRIKLINEKKVTRGKSGQLRHEAIM